jgi:hypothetical protein
MEQGVSKRRHIKFKLRGITHKKAYNIQNTSKILNQEDPNLHPFEVMLVVLKSVMRYILGSEASVTVYVIVYKMGQNLSRVR